MLMRVALLSFALSFLIGQSAGLAIATIALFVAAIGPTLFSLLLSTRRQTDSLLAAESIPRQKPPQNRIKIEHAETSAL
jgi:hypothetical protein